MGEVVVNELPSCVLKCDKAGEARANPGGVKRRQSVPEEVRGGGIQCRIEPRSAMAGLAGALALLLAGLAGLRPDTSGEQAVQGPH